jgi:hypothetical protein
MGLAAEVFQWVSIDPDATVGVFIHPYSATEFVGFCIRVNLHSNQPSGAFTSIAAQLTEGATNEFFGQIARTLWVQNQTVGPQGFISVGLIRFRQGF